MKAGFYTGTSNSLKLDLMGSTLNLPALDRRLGLEPQGGNPGGNLPETDARSRN